ncbi:Katanin p80 WD40 repeat-containing subunit B1 [Lamellibrachia satsuma]|nr:Katanin p80 WD40 repeat-containing subunit B1 [Lamellibrachia satsuma]
MSLPYVATVKQITPSLCNQRHIPADMSETEAVSMIVKGHESMMAVMTNRNKNLQVVRALWTSGNMKTAVDSAIGMNDQAVIVDVLNILLQKPNMWNLDLCASMLPRLTDLVTSKYENYIHTGCAALRLILKNFASVIKANITAPPSIGVDITREERYNKCRLCYKVLMDIRSGFGQKQMSQGKLASTFRELNILMSQLD